MDKHSRKSSTKGGILPIVLALAGFFLFLAIVAFVWLDRRPATVAMGGTPPEERLNILKEQRERERETLEQYGWVDRDAGVVRLPVERAMELLVEELNQGLNQDPSRN